MLKEEADDLRKEWKMIPVSMMVMLAISADATTLGDESDSSVSLFFLACHRIARWTINSIRNERNRPAMMMAEVVASYWSSPRHSLVSIILACVYSCWPS